MKIVEITASLGRAIQYIEFQPHNFHASIKVELEKGDDQSKAFAQAYQECENALKIEIDKFNEVYLKKKTPPSTDSKTTGTPSGEGEKDGSAPSPPVSEKAEK